MDRRVLGIVLLVVGAALLYFGYQATEAPVESAKQTITGKYSDKTTLWLVGGAAAGIAGIAMLALGARGR